MDCAEKLLEPTIFFNLYTGGGGGGGLNAFHWYQIFDLDSAVVEVQNAWRISNYCNVSS